MSPPRTPADTGDAGRFGRFLLAGGIAAAANFGSRFLFSRVLPYEAAVVAAYLVGMATAFVLMRRYAFGPGQGSVRRQVLAFTLVNAAAVLQTVLISSLLARWWLPAVQFPLDHQATAHAIGVGVPVLTSYLGHKYLTFR